MRTSPLERSVTIVVLAVGSLVALFPIAMIVASAFVSDNPNETGIVWSNLSTAWDEGHFSTYMRSSVVVTLCVVVLATALSCLLGYAFGTMRFRGSSVLFYVLLLGLMIPNEAIVVPLYYQLRELDQINTYQALIFPQVAQSLAFGTFWMRAYFRGTSRELVEAARLDGAGHFRTFWSVLLPMGRPAVVTMVVLFSMWTWNEFLLPLVMIPSNEELRTAPLGLTFFSGQYTGSPSLLAAAALIVALPMLLLFLVAQRHFIRGMTEGAVKG
ncbi:carbohydrate ABC transporter permease [Mumia quercus]|uniref:carbohydrate ABC transporter permease n=1 Tax=Mumia quercus TaxID=2976125 RepID=UPI0021D3D215|nr:carbohydrate ABC transporter permease [Mumia quercus]